MFCIYLWTSQAMYAQLNIQSPLCNRSWSGKAMNVTYSECVFVYFSTQHAMCMRNLFIRGLPGSTLSFHIISYTHDFREKYKNLKHKMCVLIFTTTFVWNFSHSNKNWERYGKKNCNGLHVMCPLFLPDFNETWIFPTHVQKKYWYTKFHKNPFSGSRVALYGQKWRS
jgi:hypothetical protein